MLLYNIYKLYIYMLYTYNLALLFKLLRSFTLTRPSTPTTLLLSPWYLGLIHSGTGLHDVA